MLPKVTDRHVRPGVQSKMKVNLAAQVMSSSVAAVFSILVTTGYMDSRCLSTAAFVKEVDSLFDSFSCVASIRDHHKVLHCRLSSKSKHLEHWQNAARKIKSM